jgi:intron-binding protein aquarius
MPVRKRPSDTASDERPPKKPSVTEPTAVVPESGNSNDLHDVYKVCVLEVDKRRRMKNIQKWEEQGALEEIIWPFLKKNLDSKDYFHACHLLVVFISHRFVEGSYAEGSSFFENIEQNEESITAIHKILATLLYKTEQTDFGLQTLIVHFLDTALCRSGSKDDPWLKIIISHVSGIKLWIWMPDRQRELELKKSAGLRRKFVGSTKEDEKMWIVTNVKTLLDLLEGNSTFGSLIKFKADETIDLPDKSDNVPPKVWLFLHRSLELLIDLLSLASTRFFLVTYLNSIDFSVRCRLAVGNEYAIPENLRLVQYLLTKINSLLAFPIQDANHKSLSKIDVLSMHHARATTLQKMAYRHYSQDLKQVIYAGVGLLCGQSSNNVSYLERSFVGFSDKDLTHLLYRLRLIPDTDETRDRHYMLQILSYYLAMPPYPTDQLKLYPLYPTEEVLWDLSIIPASSSQLRSTQVLALPKLSAQYLSFQDYLIRNFELVRLESAYDIRSDLVNAIRRVRPVLRQSSLEEDETITLKTEFNGWSRMALELVEPLRLIEVRPPKLGETTSARVTAEITVDLERCGASIRKEWEEVGEFDNLFLVTLDASKMNGAQAPLMKDYHLQHGDHKMWDTDNKERRVPDEEDGTFPNRFGVVIVRGCMVLQVRNEHGTVLSEPGVAIPDKEKGSTKKIFRVAMDTAQYSSDSKLGGASELYKSFNLVIRRHGRENNFKSILETIRGLTEGAGSISRVLPKWLQSLLLGTADPKSASYKSETMKNYALHTVGVNKPTDYLDFGDTFLDQGHLRSSFNGDGVVLDGKTVTEDDDSKDEKLRSNFKIRFSQTSEKDSEKHHVEAVSVPFSKGVAGNSIRFTPSQVEAVRSGLSPGLTLVVGPPGTGKTDVAVQIIACLYHSFPTQRTVIITHSNAALNDIFTKVMARGDIDERYMVRLGAGERDLDTNSAYDFTKIGRVSYSIERRAQLLEKVQCLSESLGISGKNQRGVDGSSSYTCETADYFKKMYFDRKVSEFESKAKELRLLGDDDNVTQLFPFQNYFQSKEVTLKEAREHFDSIADIFSELSEYRPFEMLRSQRQRADYLINKQARVVAMTCTHAAIARSNMIKLGFEYDNIVMEESGQMLEIEAFVPMLLQKGSSDKSVSGRSRLKRLCMLGDHNQLPPVVKNASFSKYSNLDQSMFARLIKLGVPYIQLDKQGRSRPEIKNLYGYVFHFHACLIL